jgi:low affinity Fe/Cu permease
MRKYRRPKSLFHELTTKISEAVGSPLGSLLAVTLIMLWLIAGPFFKFSDTWQIVITTGTSVITFLMVFLIQNTQNHDSKAVQIKLDELIRSIDSARNEIISVEYSSEKALQEIQEDFSKLD